MRTDGLSDRREEDKAGEQESRRAGKPSGRGKMKAVTGAPSSLRHQGGTIHFRQKI